MSPLVRVQQLKVHFPVRAGFLRPAGEPIKAVDDVSFVFSEERGVAAGEAVDVDGENIFTQQFVSRQMRDGRAEAAVGVVAFVALEPVVHFAFRILEHIKFLRGFSDMDADAPFSFERGAGGEAQQFR